MMKTPILFLFIFLIGCSSLKKQVLNEIIIFETNEFVLEYPKRWNQAIFHGMHHLSKKKFDKNLWFDNYISIKKIENKEIKGLNKELIFDVLNQEFVIPLNLRDSLIIKKENFFEFKTMINEEYFLKRFYKSNNIYEITFRVNKSKYNSSLKEVLTILDSFKLK